MDPWLSMQLEKRLGESPHRLGQVKDIADECAREGAHRYDPAAERCVRCGYRRVEELDT